MDLTPTQFADGRERFGTYWLRPLAAPLNGGEIAFAAVLILVDA